MNKRIALAGNPNCGKTTLFNALTGSNQFVGNWPGVTVEKKEGKLKKHDDVIIVDLPGIYSLSPYTLEEVVARNYLVEERPDAILNIVDGTNLERNLYLTTQLTELGIPVVVAINMMDVVRRRGDVIDLNGLSKALGARVIEISALKGDGIFEAAELAVSAVGEKGAKPVHSFSGSVEHALAHIEEAAVHELPKDIQRWYAIKIFERDERVISKLKIDKKKLEHIEEDIVDAERELDDDAESIITNERYNYVAGVLKGVYVKHKVGKLSASDKIDRIVTNRWAALPIFALIMFLVYFISVTTVGTWVTDFTNDGLFGDGWHFLGIGSGEYEQALDSFASPLFESTELRSYIESASVADVPGASSMLSAFDDKDFHAFSEAYSSYGELLVLHSPEAGELLELYFGENANAPSAENYGIWVLGVPVIFDNALTAINCAPWLRELVVDGIVGGVGAVLGFVPQLLVLFIFLAFLEACGYMSRIAFVMDRIFRKFGLSGKSFIPMLIGTGCSVPGIMASRTIENERDRRMTIMTTSFIPCGAKIPVIALVSGVIFGGAWWVAPLAYFVGVAAVVISGVILKKTKRFSGEPSPFVMELPAYHMPTFVNIMRSMWERGWSFIKKAGTVILLSTVIIWFGNNFGIYEGAYAFSGSLPADAELEITVLGAIGASIGWVFAPLGFSGMETAIATLMGLIAKEEIVAVLGVLDFAGMSKLAAFSFLLFNLLCAPCFAAVGAMRREFGDPKWTWFAIGYQCLFAYAVSFCIYQLGMFFSGAGHVFGAIIAFSVIAAVLYLMLRPEKASRRE